MQLETIAKSEQKDFISSFWTLLQEAETKADNDDDKVLKHWVEQFYHQWNRVTGSDQKPRWIRRKDQLNLEKLVKAVDKANGHV